MEEREGDRIRTWDAQRTMVLYIGALPSRLWRQREEMLFSVYLHIDILMYCMT